MRMILIGAALAASSSLALAQTTNTSKPMVATTPQPTATTAVQSPTVAVIAPSDQTNVIRSGTEVMLTMSEALTTNGKKLRPGQRFQMTVAAPVMAGNQTVIPTGSVATGEVTDVRNKGMWGKSGRINARVLYVRVGDRQVRLTGVFDDKGTTGTAGVVGAIAVLPIAGFFVTGTSANIPMGAPVKAFLDEDLTVTFASKADPIAVVPVKQ